MFFRHQVLCFCGTQRRPVKHGAPTPALAASMTSSFLVFPKAGILDRQCRSEVACAIKRRDAASSNTPPAIAQASGDGAKTQKIPWRPRGATVHHTGRRLPRGVIDVLQVVQSIDVLHFRRVVGQRNHRGHFHTYVFVKTVLQESGPSPTWPQTNLDWLSAHAPQSARETNLLHTVTHHHGQHTATKAKHAKGPAHVCSFLMSRYEGCLDRAMIQKRD